MSAELDNVVARDKAHWAEPVSKLHVTDVPAGAVNFNVEGRQVVGPLQGFGQLWQRTYRVRLSGAEVTPQEVVAQWKQNLPELMPDDSRFYTSVAGVEPGEIVLINATLPLVPSPVETGVMVLYSDDESFTLMCPEGHPVSGWNTFSAYVDESATVAQIQSLERASDPIGEFHYRVLGGSAQQERLWTHVLTQLADQFGIAGQVQSHKILVDPRVQWSEAKNIWYNAVLRSTLNLPVRLVGRLFGRAN